MKYFVLLLLPLIILTACADSPAAPVQGGQYADPKEMVAVGQARIQGTAEAQAEEIAQSTRQAAEAEQKTKNEIAVIMAPLTATSESLKLESTAAAITEAAHNLKATDTAFSATVTAQVVKDEQRQEAAALAQQEANNRANLGQFLLAGIIAIALGLSIYLTYGLAKTYIHHKIQLDKDKMELLKKKYSYLTLADNSVVYTGASGPEIIQTPALPAGGPKRLPAWGDGTILDSVPSLGSGRRSDDSSTTGRALALVEKGISLYGPYSIKIPSRDDMDWNPSMWQRATDPLKELGIIMSDPGQGTYLVEGGRYQNLRELYLDLHDGKLVLRPSPTPSYPIAGD